MKKLASDASKRAVPRIRSARVVPANALAPMLAVAPVMSQAKGERPVASGVRKRSEKHPTRNGGNRSSASGGRKIPRRTRAAEVVLKDRTGSLETNGRFDAERDRTATVSHPAAAKAKTGERPPTGRPGRKQANDRRGVKRS